MTQHGGDRFMPHGYCFLWKPDLLWLHVLSDAGIVVAYMGIPLVLLYVLRRRRDLPFQGVFALFGAFILLCGFTHFLNIWVLWRPDYYFEGVVKALTAIASIATLIALVVRIPLALSLPSPRQLTEANAKLADLYQKSQEQGRAALSVVLDNVTDGIFTIDERGQNESFNAACARMFGYGPDEVTGRNIAALIPEPDQKKHEGFVRDYLGAEKVIWLPYGVYLDETNGHVDNFCRFVKPGTVMLTWTDDATDPQYERSLAALKVLESGTDAGGRRIEVVKIHQPGPILISEEEASGVDAVDGTLPRHAGDRLAGSYVNSYIGNDIVVLPVFDDPHDEAALAAYQELFAPRRIVTVPGREILLGGGNVHCITQQQPSGR